MEKKSSNEVNKVDNEVKVELPNLAENKSQEVKSENTPPIIEPTVSNVFGPTATQENQLPAKSQENPDVQQTKVTPPPKLDPPKNSTEVKIDNQDQIIAEIAPEKEKSPLVIVFLFLILIIFALALPNVSEYVEKYKNSKIPISSNSNNGLNSSNNQNNQQEVIKYPLNEGTSIEFADFTINNFQFTTNNELVYINYHITKKSPEITLPNSLYIELYNSENTLLSRAKIPIENQNAETELDLQSVVYEGTDTNSTQISVLSIEEKDYPFQELFVYDDYQYVFCKQGRHTLTYYFQNYSLKEFLEEFTGIRSAMPDTYDMELNELRTLNNQLSNMGDNIDSSLMVSDTGFTMINTFYLNKNIDLKSFNKPYYYSGGTSSRKVIFEMESIGYTCGQE